MSTNHKKKRRYNDDVDDDDDTDDSNTGGSDSSSSSSSESNNGVYESEAFKKFEYASGSDDDDDEDEDGEAADGKDERNKRYTYSMVNGKIRRTPSKSKAARFSINRSTNAGTTTAGRSRVYSGINGDDGDSDNDDDEACDNIFDVSKRGKEEKERRKQSKAITWKTQFIGSVWKNARYLKRNHTRLAWIIAFPLFVLWAVWGTMCGVLAVNKPISTYNHPLMDYPEALLPSFSATEATGMCNKERSSCGLAVYPSDASTWSIGFLLRDALKDPATGRKPAINYFDDEDELAKEMSDFPGKHFAGVAFHCRWGACRNYTMYMSAELLPLRADESRDASVNVFSPITAAYHNASLYVSSGLVTLQNAVDSSLTRTETLSQHFFNLTVRTKLLPADPVNYIALPLGALLSAGGGLALIPLLCACVELILFERIRRVRYYLFMLGMRKSAYWLALVLAVGIPGVAVGAGWVVVCTTAVWPGGGAAAVAILAVAWVGYLVTLLLFVFAVHKIADTRFWNFFIVTAFAGVLPAVGSLVPSGGTVQGVLATFLSPYTFYLAVASVVGDSLHGPDPTPFSTAEVLAYLLSNVVLYGLICCYINESCSGDYGVSRGPLFFIHRSYWRPARQTTLMEKAQFSKNALPPRNFEPPLAEDFGVRIYGLTKEYDGKTGRGKTGCAVHSLSAPFTKGQVTCILGQNGSGKTSLLAMLCGLVKPTSGEAVVDGRSILSDAGAIQKVVGYCPEADVLYPDLTPEDHVDLIACIRGTKSRLSGSKLTGLSSGNTKERPGLSGSGFAARVLSDVGLLDKRRSKASTLTPGMRRRLTLALSLIGDPKIVFLDEPTGDASEVDIASKRIIWTALKRIRGARRTIVFTSRSIEEAEQLGDYVYFMDEGRFKCGGSPDFLERRFGVGYYLNVVTKAESKIKDVVKECVPAATFVASTTKSVLFRLPFSQTQLYSALFRRLENDAAALGVEKFKLHLNTLGDVFSKICTKGLAKPASESAAKPHSEKDSASEGDNEEEDEEDKLYSRNVAPSVEDYSPTNTQCMEGGVSSEGVHPSLPTSPNATSPVGFNASYGSRSMGAPGKSGHSHVMEKRRASFARQFAAVCKCKFIYFVRRATIFVPIVLVPLVYLVLSLFVVNGCFHVLDVNNEKAKLSFHNISRYEPSYIPFVLGTGSDVVLEDIDKLTQAMESPTLRMAPVENVSVLNHIAYSRGNNINAGLIFNAFNVNKNRADITIMYNQTDPTAPVAIMDFLHTGIYSLLRGKHCDPPGVWVSPVVTSAIRSAVTTPSSVSENLTYGIVGAIMTVLACVRISTKMAKSTIEERVSGFKSQLYEAGLRPVAYVLATVCTSLVPLISTYVIFEAVFAAFGVTEFAETSTFFIVFVGMLLFFISLWSFSIAFGNLFTSPSNGSRALYTILVILTVVPILLSLLFYFAPHSVASVFEFIFGLLSPPYAFANFLFSLLTQGKYISIESRLLWKK